MKTKNLVALAGLFLSILNPRLSIAFAQGTAFTYQGRLTDNGSPANGSYDLQFTLFGVSSGGSAIAGPLTTSHTGVTNGLFTVTLDFGAGLFTGADRWLQISTRTNGGGAFSNLSPRQPIAPSPYAIHAGGVSASGITGAISSNNIAAGTISQTMLAAGAVGANQLAPGAVTTGALADGAVTAAKVGTVSNWFALTIANSTPAAGDFFGYAVAALGSDRLLIGAPGDDTGTTTHGAAHLFSTNGKLLATFTNPTPTAGESFGVSVAAVGSDRVLIGAPGSNGRVAAPGAAYLFSTNGTLLTTFTNPTPALSDSFGVSVAAVGSDRVLIGAPGNGRTTAPGTAYLFSTNGTLLTIFTNPAPAAFDSFGFSVAAVRSDRVLIGAPGDDTGATNAGAAYLFSTNGTLLTIFTNPTPATFDFFGNSVAAVGSDRVLIGAPQDDTGATNAGAAYLFSTNGALLTTFTNPTPAANDFFGVSVAAVGSDRVLIGAERDHTGATNAGAAYLFSTNGTLLTTFTNPTPATGDRFGYAVAAVGSDRVLIGAYEDDTGAAAAGAAYLFGTESYAPGLIADGVNARSITAAQLEDGAVTAAKIGGVLFPSQIPDLDASKITSGVLDANRIPDLDASKITSGTLADARLSANVALLDRSPQTFTGGTNVFNGSVGIGTTAPESELHIFRNSAGSVTANVGSPGTELEFAL